MDDSAITEVTVYTTERFIMDTFHVGANVADGILAMLSMFQALRKLNPEEDTVTHETVLEALNKQLDGHGIEAVDPEGAPHFTDNGIHLCPPYSYVNMGDSYTTTIARDHKRGRWVVACWADLQEAVEKEYKLGDYARFEARPERCVACHAKNMTMEKVSDGYAWVCDSCNHYHLAEEGFDPESTDESNEVAS